jgi:hypothetical protein
MQRKYFAVGVLASYLAACSSSTEPLRDGGGPPPSCADRSETYADDFIFPLDPGREIRGLSACAPRCGAEKRFDGLYASDALPAGTCTPSDVTCSFAAHEICPCPTNRGPVSGYQCSCESGKWSCVIVSRGASTCSVRPADSGSPCPLEAGAGQE